MSALLFARVTAVLAVVFLGAAIGVVMTAGPTPVPERAGNVHVSAPPFIWTARGPVSFDQLISAIAVEETQSQVCVRSGSHKGC